MPAQWWVTSNQRSTYMSCYQSTSPAQLFSQFAVLDVDQGPKRTLVMIAHTRSELPCCVERPGVEWPVAPVLRLGEVIYL